MKNNAVSLFVSILLMFLITSMQAQETIPSTGGDISGIGGSISYTVGQV